MTALSLRQLAHSLGGEVSGKQVLAPGPGHSARDRSMWVRFSTTAPEGMLVGSFSGQHWQECRDFVRERLGMPTFAPGRREAPSVRQPPAPVDDAEDRARRIALALRTWDAAGDPAGTVVETYLASRGLVLPPDASDVIRFHPRCAWREGDATIFVPAMVCAMRTIAGDGLVAVHRTRLTEDGRKVDRRMLGPAAGTAVKIDEDASVITSVTIGEGVETCLAARQLGFAPVWALASAGAIATFPVLQGVRFLKLLAERDPASERAVQACGSRWHAADRGVQIARTRHGSDMNDALRASA